MACFGFFLHLCTSHQKKLLPESYLRKYIQISAEISHINGSRFSHVPLQFRQTARNCRVVGRSFVNRSTSHTARTFNSYALGFFLNIPCNSRDPCFFFYATGTIRFPLIVFAKIHTLSCNLNPFTYHFPELGLRANNNSTGYSFRLHSDETCAVVWCIFTPKNIPNFALYSLLYFFNFPRYVKHQTVHSSPRASQPRVMSAQFGWNPKIWFRLFMKQSLSRSCNYA